MLRSPKLSAQILVVGLLLSLVCGVAIGPAILALAHGREISLSAMTDEFVPMNFPFKLNYSFDSISGTDRYFSDLRWGETVFVAVQLDGNVERPLSVTRELKDADAAADFVIRGTVEEFRPMDNRDQPYGRLALSFGIQETTLGGMPRVPSDFDESRGRRWKYIIAVLPSGHAVLKAITVNGIVVWENTPW